MMIGFATLTIDPLGALLLNVSRDGTNLGDTTRRVSRVATLDGGATILDGGYTVADRTIIINLADQTRVTVEALKHMTEVHSKVLVLTEAGAFTATPSSIADSVRSATMTLLVSGVAEIKA